jgi:glycerophosphoryl diester phosphodiesterase
LGRYLETDPHLTRDGVVVAFHDARLDDVTDCAGAIAARASTRSKPPTATPSLPTAGCSFPFLHRGVRVAAKAARAGAQAKIAAKVCGKLPF